MSEEVGEEGALMDVGSQRFPFCIVWGPLPCITWILPIIGHFGICDSSGRVHDFAGPYYVGVDQFMTGDVYRYLKLDHKDIEHWNKSIEEADEEYRHRMHNLCCDNCHSHVAYALSRMNYRNSSWSMISAWWLLTSRGSFVSAKHMIMAWIPFIMILLLIICLVLFV